MKKLRLLLFLPILALLMTACAYGSETDTGAPEANKKEEASPKGTDAKYADGKTSQATNTDVPLRDFFIPPGATALYKGEGHERAELRVQSAQPYEKHFVVYEKNGESGERYVRRTYRLDEDKIVTLEETLVDYEDDFPTLEEVQDMDPVGTYLEKPFEKGTTFDGWTIVETDVTVETPYREFDNAFVVEQKNDESVVRKYFVQGFGEVKRESISQTADGKELIVASTLKSVNGVSR